MMLADEIVNKDRGLPRKPYIIAEAGVNHEGCLDTAHRLIGEASEAGADAIKFQTYLADSIAIKDSPAYWDLEEEPTVSQHALFSKYDKFWKPEFEQLKVWCDDADIEFLSTPFDAKSAQFLDDLMGTFKISSSDITNKPFINLITSFGKPILMSTGASNLDEIDEALSWILEKDIQVALMHCVLSYPTPEDGAHLAMINGLRARYPAHVVGYSDHTLPKGMENLHLAWLLGARILEKHFTHDKTLKGNDHYHAMDAEDLKRFVDMVAKSQRVLGETEKRSLEFEESARRNARRSLVTAIPISSGTVLTEEMLTWKRPASGISPAKIDEVIGRKVNCNLEQDQTLTYSHLHHSRNGRAE